MATIERFEDLLCWQEARIHARNIYGLLRECRDYGFRDQIQRAAVSAMNNIAEGFSRFGVKEKIQFFNIAVSSLNEVRSMLYLGYDLAYIDQTQLDQELSKNQKVKDLTYGFLKHLHEYKNSSTE